jgi:MFS family permease
MFLQNLPEWGELKEQVRGRRGRGKLFYGWFVVIGGWWLLLVAYGTRFYGFPVFYRVMMTDMGWTGAQTQLGMSASTFLYGCFSPFLGRALPWMGARNMMTMGCIIAAIGFFLLGTLTELWQFIIYYSVIMTFGITAMALLPNNTVVGNWFIRKRGTGIGIISTGIGFGWIIIGSMVAPMLIASYGWAGAFWGLAIIMFVLGTPVAFFVMRTRPEDMGMLPDGDKPGEAAAAAEAAKPAKRLAAPGEPGGNLFTRRVGVYDYTFGQAIKTITFWCIGLCALIWGIGYMACVMTQYAYCFEIGLSRTEAAAALGLPGFFSIVFRFVFGWAGDQIDKRWMLAIGLLCQALAGVVLTMATDMTLLYPYAILIGASVGGVSPLLPAICGDRYGRKNMGTIYGFVGLFLLTIGTGTGPMLGGIMFDVTGAYPGAYLSSSALALIGFILGVIAVPVKPPKGAQV